MMLTDLIPKIEKTYGILPGRENRAMAGLSMGEMQTFLTTLSNMDKFTYIGGFSGSCSGRGGAFDPKTSCNGAFGGPVYFYRDLIYNTPTGSLKYIEGSSGVLTYNNTIIGEGRAGPTSNQHFRNNLIFAQGAFDPVFGVTTSTNYSSSDYNGFRPNSNVEDSFEWSSPPFEKTADYEHAPLTRHFKTLKEYSEATGQDKHSVLVDYNVFEKVTMPDRTDPQRVYDPSGFNFELRPGSAAVDAGIVLPNINDGYTGRAPDLGAYESGKHVPHYGPRP
jgi:hypothetical protein